MSANPQTDERPLLFISHKHADKKIADVIRSFVTSSSGGRVEVFQSSSPWADTPKVGRNLNKQLRETLWRANVVILVYTCEGQDWTYCMWECGVASHPQSPDTKVILFQCTADAPALFAEQVNVNVRILADIQKFTNEFLTDPTFFPELSAPLTLFPTNGQEVANAAAEFYQKLQPVLPPEKEDPSVEWPAFPFLRLELGLQDVDVIAKAGPKDRARVAAEVIPNKCLVSTSDKYLDQLFGMPSVPSSMSLQQLIDTWRERYPDSQSKWVEALSGQITDGALWKFPRVTWELMQGLNDESWYAPVLNHVRKIPTRQCMQFDVYFYKFNVDPQKKSVAVNLPQDEAV